MTKYFLFMILSACFVLLILPAFAAANSDHGDRVCIYKHDNFQGHEQCYRPGEEVSDLKHIDINSVRVFGHARVMLFEDRDFHGRMMEFSSDMPDLSRVAVSGSKSWHDHVGSLRVVPEVAFFDRDRDRFYDRGHYPSGDTYIYRSKPTFETIDQGVCVYEKPGFEGRSQCWSANTDISDLSFATGKTRFLLYMYTDTLDSSDTKIPSSVAIGSSSITTLRIWVIFRWREPAIGITKSGRWQFSSNNLQDGNCRGAL